METVYTLLLLCNVLSFALDRALALALALTLVCAFAIVCALALAYAPVLIQERLQVFHLPFRSNEKRNSLMYLIRAYIQHSLKACGTLSSSLQK